MVYTTSTLRLTNALRFIRDHDIQGGTEISSKMCNISNSHGRASEGTSWQSQVRGLRDGPGQRAWLQCREAVRGALPSRQCAVGGKQGIPKKRAISPWNVCSFCRKKISQEICMVCENFTRNLLLVVLLNLLLLLLSVLRMF